MFETLWLVAAAVLSLAGMAWLALAMEVHWVQVMQDAADVATRPSKVARALGAFSLGLSLLACSTADRPSMAVLVWVMLQACSAVTVAMLLVRWPKVLRVLWPVRPG